MDRVERGAALPVRRSVLPSIMTAPGPRHRPEEPTRRVPPSHSTETPQHYGPYRVLGTLGRGGMGTVYRALDTRLHREVALKVLRSDLGVSAARERFLREARAVSSLNHPNICMVFDIGEQEGEPYLVMELLQGTSLKERLEHGPLAPDDLRELAYRVALALSVAHARGIIHRDIKPANLFMANDGMGMTDVKVLDFGLAKVDRDPLGDTLPGLTRHGATVGTVEYMSPEQACGEPLDARSDLFSLGTVLYEAATGRTPFRGATSAIIFSELLTMEPTPPREANLQVPASLDAIIRGLLVKDPLQRTGSAAALIEQLNAELDVPAPTPLPESVAANTMLPGLLHSISERITISGSSSARADNSPEIPAAPALVVTDASHTAVANYIGSSAATAAHKTAPVDSATAQSSPAEASATSPPRLAHPSAREPGRDVVEDPVAARGVRPRAVLFSNSRPQARFVLEEPAAPTTQMVEVAASPARPVRSVAVAAVAAALLLAAVGLYAWKHLSASPAAFTGILQLSSFHNRTGDPSLDRAPAAGLQILLDEAGHFAVRPFVPTSSASAQAVKSMAVAQLDAVLDRDADGYRLRIDVNGSSGRAMAHVEEQASAIDALPAALDRAVSELRERLGDKASPDMGEPDLKNEASTSFAALSSYGDALEAERLGERDRAVMAFSNAIAQDSRFTLARLRLSALLLRAHAEGGTAEQLAMLRALPESGGPHLRSWRAYLLSRADAAGDPLDIAKRWASERPHDATALATLTDVLLQRSDAAAVASSHSLIDLLPDDRSAHDLQAEALLAAGHPEAAWSVEGEAFAAGLGSPGLSLLAAHAGHDQAGIEASLRNVRANRDEVQRFRDLAVFEAAVGDIASSTRDWIAAADRLPASGPMHTAAADARARARLNQALTGHCMEMSPPFSSTPQDGDSGAFELIAEAWCGGHITVSRTPVDPLAAAAARWLAGDAAGASSQLNSLRIGRNSALAALIRGHLQAASGDAAGAVADYRAALAGRGVAQIEGLATTAAAYAGLVKVYTTLGDPVNAENSRRSLLELWKDAPRMEPLLRDVAGAPESL